MDVRAIVVGGTGLVGRYFLSNLENDSNTKNILAFARRNDQLRESDKLQAVIEQDSSKWDSTLASKLQTNTTGVDNSILFCALGTTRAKAGGIENQRKIDHDLPIAIAKEYAKQRAIISRNSNNTAKSVLVLTSSTGANSKSFIPYSKMKGQVEDVFSSLTRPSNDIGSFSNETVTNAAIDHVVILRPGLIVGERRKEDNRPTEKMLHYIADFIGGTLGMTWLKDMWAQDAEVIARAGINVAEKCLRGEIKEKVLILAHDDIIKYGRTVWNKVD